MHGGAALSRSGKSYPGRRFLTFVRDRPPGFSYGSMRALADVCGRVRGKSYAPKNSRTARAEAQKPVRSAARAAGTVCRVRIIPAEPKYTAMV